MSHNRDPYKQEFKHYKFSYGIFMDNENPVEISILGDLTIAA